MLPSAKRRKNITTKLPIRGFVDLTYTGTKSRIISAKAGKLYNCTPNGTVKVCDIDVEGLVSLGCFRQGE